MFLCEFFLNANWLLVILIVICETDLLYHVYNKIYYAHRNIALFSFIFAKKY